MTTATAQQIALAIAPKITNALSIWGSCIVCYLSQRSSRKRNGSTTKPTYHRLLFGMAFSDLAASSASFFTTWPIPVDTPGVYGAVGTKQTCSAQGFFGQIAVSSVMYNAALSTYYFLVIVRQWSDSDIVRIEPLFHLNAIVWGLGTCIASLALGLFNGFGWQCWITSIPLGCIESWQTDGGVTTCTRGDNGSLYQWAFFFAPLWAVLIFVTILMFLVYSKIRRQMQAMEQFTQRRESQEGRVDLAKQFARQATLYVGAFYATWFFSTILMVVNVSSHKAPYVLVFLNAFFGVSIQGFLNLIVYTNRKYLHYRKVDPTTFFIVTWFRMLLGELRGNDLPRILSTTEKSEGESSQIPN